MSDETLSLVDRFDTHVSLDTTDAAGVIFAGSPIGWSELGFENLWRLAGNPLQEVISRDLHYPTVNVTVDHFRPLRLGDAITVSTWVESVGRRSVRTITEIRNDRGGLATTVRRVNVAVSRRGDVVEAEPWLRAIAHDSTAGHGG